jgi:outer membrane receptor protein involved in Fe transport
MIRTLAAALATTTCLVALATPAAAQTREFNIPPGSLRAALDAFARQTGRQVIYRGDEVGSKRSPGVRGAHTAEEALDAILAGTGFKAQKDSSGAFAVAKVGNAPAIAEASSSSGEANNTIVVTGTNIRGFNPESSHLENYSRDSIQQSGSTTVEDFLSRLPANHATLNSTAPVGFSGSPSNEEVGTGVDLRGLGVGSTLVLLNGHRVPPAGNLYSPDLSLIPLGAIERVDVLLDGASAIYGADAIGGVANFILRRRMDGFESHLGVGLSNDGGGREVRADQLAGTTWSTGSALLGYSFYDRRPIDASQRSFSAPAAPFTLVPADKKQSLLFSGEQDIGAQTQITADALYSDRKTSYQGFQPFNALTQNSNNHERQFFGDASVHHALSDRLNISASISYARFKGNDDFSDLGTGYTSIQNTQTRTSYLDADAQLDGVLFTLPSGPIKFAVGGGYSRESLDLNVVNQGTTPSTSLVSTSRSIGYGFGELHVPLIPQDETKAVFTKLNVDIAGRYTKYSDFGAQFSPKFGATLGIFSGLSAVGSYSESFRAPPLIQTVPTVSRNYFYVFPPSLFGFPDIWSPTGSTIELAAFGTGNASLKAERAKSFSGGLEWRSAKTPWLRARIDYYNVRYNGRILAPDPTNGSVAFFSPQDYADIITVNPTAAQIAAATGNSLPVVNTTSANPSDPNSLAKVVTVLLDDRVRNLATSHVSGIDGSLSIETPVPWGTISLGAQGSYILASTEKVLSSSPAITQVGILFHPPRFRGQAYVAASAGRWKGRLTVDYVGPSTNNTVAGNPRISAWAPLTLTTSYALGEPAGRHGVLLSLTVQNLLNADPPHVDFGTNTTGLLAPLGFDPTNASPVGRFISADVTVRW